LPIRRRRGKGLRVEGSGVRKDLGITACGFVIFNLQFLIFNFQFAILQHALRKA
jgi:hypothetical protein